MKSKRWQITESILIETEKLAGIKRFFSTATIYRFSPTFDRFSFTALLNTPTFSDIDKHSNLSSYLLISIYQFVHLNFTNFILDFTCWRNLCIQISIVQEAEIQDVWIDKKNLITKVSLNTNTNLNGSNEDESRLFLRLLWLFLL